MSLLDHAYWSLMLTALTTLALGIFVLWKKPQQPTSRLLIFLHFLVTLWSFGESQMIIARTPAAALFWTRVAMAGVVLDATACLHFCLALLNKSRTHRHLLSASYLFSALFFCLLWSPFFLVQPQPKFYLRYFAEPGPLFYPFIIAWTATVAYALTLLYRGYRHAAEPTVRNQLKYVFIALLCGYIGGSSNFLWVFNINLPPYNPFGTYGTPIYSAIMTYAIVKHHLLDISVIIRKSAIYSALIGLITAVYFGVVYLLGMSFGSFSGKQQFGTTFVALIVIAIVFKPTERRIQKILDHYFFKDTAEAIARENEHFRAEMVRAEQMKAVSLLASGMAHEIKNPLTAIKTFIEYLDERHHDPEYRAKFKRIASAEIEKIHGSVRQLLAFAKPQPTQFCEVQLSQVLDETLELLSNDLVSHQIHVERQYNGHDTIRGDATQLKQVFLNLFLNSADAMPRVGRLAVATSGSNGSIAVTIADTGCGIPHDMLDTVFDPFVTTKLTGTGLGLSVVHQIVKDHHAQIHVDSRLNAGTRFTLTFERTSKQVTQ